MRKGFVLAGTICLIVAWLGPLPLLAKKAFFAHMIMHMMVVAVAAPFLSFGIINSSYDPALKYPSLFAPVTAAIAELIIVWAWHAPSLHHFARHTKTGLFLEQGMFLMAGVWVWLSSLSGSTTGNSARMGAGIIGLLLTSMHMTLLGALLNLSMRSLYNHHHGYRSLNVLQDQQLGGAIMLVIGGISYLSGGIWLALKMLKKREYP